MINIGVICPSEIAFRRFMPALLTSHEFRFAGIAIASSEEWKGRNSAQKNSEREKATSFTTTYGGYLFESYSQMVNSDNIDAVYLPLPPALHYYWAKQCLLAGKHILVEKPFTTDIQQTKELISIANERQLAIHENYMFVFHNQLKDIQEVINGEKIGEIRLYRVSFGFPKRNHNDFRYNKKLGGGALLDCGGYTIKYASLLLGSSVKVQSATLNYTNEFEVDLFGSGVLTNSRNDVVQIAFGMDNSYKCELEVWGSKGVLYTNRVLTAPAGFIPEMILEVGGTEEIYSLSSDDAFVKSIQYFQQCIEDEATRQDNYKTVNKQAELVNQFIEKA